MRLLDRYKLEVLINQAIGVEDETIHEYDDPKLRQIMQDATSEDRDLSWVFDVRDIWDLKIERKRGNSKPVKVLAYLESGVTLDVRLEEADELLEVWRKRTYKRR